MEKTRNNNSSRICGGLIIMGVGLVFLLKNIGINIPDWVINWPTLLIIIGLLIGYKRNFNGPGWLIVILVGVFFTVKSIVDFDVSKYYFALIFIVLGLILIFKPRRLKGDHDRWEGKWKSRMKRKYADLGNLNIPGNEYGGDKYAGIDKNYADIDKNDIIDSVNIFGGSHHKVYSKNFKGGDVIAVFGGADIDLTQTDFDGVIKLDLVAIFGGVKIIIPPSWEVKSEVTAIFGGIDDKRTLGVAAAEPRKILIIEGVAMFGGVDIRNF
jgi:predicted membrane protein